MSAFGDQASGVDRSTDRRETKLAGRDGKVIVRTAIVQHNPGNRRQKRD